MDNKQAGKHDITIRWRHNNLRRTVLEEGPPLSLICACPTYLRRRLRRSCSLAIRLLWGCPGSGRLAIDLLLLLVLLRVSVRLLRVPIRLLLLLVRRRLSVRLLHWRRRACLTRGRRTHVHVFHGAALGSGISVRGWARSTSWRCLDSDSLGIAQRSGLSTRRVLLGSWGKQPAVVRHSEHTSKLRRGRRRQARLGDNNGNTEGEADPKHRFAASRVPGSNFGRAFRRPSSLEMLNTLLLRHDHAVDLRVKASLYHLHQLPLPPHVRSVGPCGWFSSTPRWLESRLAGQHVKFR